MLGVESGPRVEAGLGFQAVPFLEPSLVEQKDGMRCQPPGTGHHALPATRDQTQPELIEHGLNPHHHATNRADNAVPQDPDTTTARPISHHRSTHGIPLSTTTAPCPWPTSLVTEEGRVVAPLRCIPPQAGLHPRTVG